MLNVVTGINPKFYPITSKHAAPTLSLHQYNTMPRCLLHAIHVRLLFLFSAIKRPLASPLDYFP